MQRAVCVHESCSYPPSPCYCCCRHVCIENNGSDCLKAPLLSSCQNTNVSKLVEMSINSSESPLYIGYFQTFCPGLRLKGYTSSRAATNDVDNVTTLFQRIYEMSKNTEKTAQDECLVFLTNSPKTPNIHFTLTYE